MKSSPKAKFKPLLSKEGVLREVATLLSGSVVAQAITLVAYFVLLRIYSAEDYGLYSIFYSYIEVIVIFSTCKYELAIVPAASDSQASAVARFALRLNAIVSLVLLCLLTFLTLTGTLPGKFSRLGGLALLIAPMVYFCGSTRVYAELYNRHHRYREIAAADVTYAGSAATLKTLFGLIGIHSAGMPLGTVIGQAAANLLYRLKSRKWRMEIKNNPDSTASNHSTISTYKNYPLYVAPKDLLNSLSANLPFIWLALYFDNAAVGLFGLAMTFIIQPTQLLCASIERVLYARSAEAVLAKHKLTPMLCRYIIPAGIAALLAAVALWFLAEPLFGMLFGGRWSGCGPYVRALLPWAVVSVVSLPLMFIPNIFGTQRIELTINIVRLVLRASAIAVGIAMGDFLAAVWLFAGVSTGVSIALLTWYLVQTRRHDSSLIPVKNKALNEK